MQFTDAGRPSGGCRYTASHGMGTRTIVGIQSTGTGTLSSGAGIQSSDAGTQSNGARYTV